MSVLTIVVIGLALMSEQKASLLEPSSVGAVEGIVLGGDGEPLVDATVFALPQREYDVRQQFRTQTDDTGHFVLTNLPVGDAYVQAFKERDGYPYNMFALFSMPGVGPILRVTIVPGDTLRGVMIRLGAKAAVLKFHITDEQGTPLGASAAFERPDLGNEMCYGTGLSADQSMLVLLVPFRLTVERDGYEAWHFGGIRWREDDGLIRLQSGQALDVYVRLRLGGPSPTGTTGSIRGTVVDGDDGFLVDTSVYAQCEDLEGTQTRIMTTTTTAGTFIMNRLEPGTCSLWARPHGCSHGPSDTFYTMPGRQLPTVHVTAGTVTQAPIRLGPLDGCLGLTITDEDGQPIGRPAHMVLSRPDLPERLERNMRDRDVLAVPATAIRLSIEAEGYVDWHFGGDAWLGLDGLLIVNPGERRELKVRLRRQAKHH